MLTTETDRRHAALQAKRLSPAQLAAKLERERCFNAGYDAMVDHLQGQIRMPIDRECWTYTQDRSERFQSWDLRWRAASDEKA